jgi:hypothetical protein
MVTPRQAWCPASRHPAEPGRGQLTRSHARSHRSALGLPTRPATPIPTDQHTAEPSNQRVMPPCPTRHLTRPTVSLPTRHVVVVDWPHPPVQLVTITATLEHGWSSPAVHEVSDGADDATASARLPEAAAARAQPDTGPQAQPTHVGSPRACQLRRAEPSSQPRPEPSRRLLPTAPPTDAAFGRSVVLSWMPLIPPAPSSACPFLALATLGPHRRPSRRGCNLRDDHRV